MKLDSTFEDTMLREITGELAAPFKVDSVSWRVGSTTQDKSKGTALAYIDARDVMDRFDEVCGIANWQAVYDDAGNGKTCCKIGVKLDGEWVWKSNGAGDTNIEADKGAFSDAFKRAAVMWGVGRYLYDLPSPWVALDGKRIAESEYPKLRALLDSVSGERGLQTPGERHFLRAYLKAVNTFVTADNADQFIADNKDVLSAMTNAQKQEIWKAITRIKEGA